MKDKKPRGIKVFGILIIATSLFQLRHLLNFNYYTWLFNPIPENFILIRYFFSVLARIIGLIAGAGILFHKDLFRKIALLLFAVIPCITYWKHPFFAVYKHSQATANVVFKSFCVSCLLTPAMIKSIAIASMLILYITDIGFSVCLIYYFTRPKIKQWFS